MLYLIVCDITYYIIWIFIMYDCKNWKTYHVLYYIYISYIYIHRLSIHYILHMNVVFFVWWYPPPPTATGNHQLVLSQKFLRNDGVRRSISIENRFEVILFVFVLFLRRLVLPMRFGVEFNTFMLTGQFSRRLSEDYAAKIQSMFRCYVMVRFQSDEFSCSFTYLSSA